MNIHLLMHASSLDELREYGTVSDVTYVHTHKAFYNGGDGVDFWYELYKRYPNEYTVTFEDNDGKYLITYQQDAPDEGIIITQIEKL